MKLLRLIYVLLIISAHGYGQNNGNPYSLWTQESLSGAFGLKAHYRNQQRILGSGFEESIQGTLLSAGILLESKSFIMHPNFMGLDIDLEYNPEKVDEQYITIPDRSEVRTLKRLSVRSVFFQEKNITLNAFVNLNQSNINRENFTNSLTTRKFYGGGLYYKNKVLPFSVTYQEGNWDQKEIETGRIFSYWQRNVKGRLSKSFTANDKHVLTYTYDDYIRKEFFILPRHNTVNFAELNSNMSLDSRKKYYLSTLISNHYQIGSDNLNRFQIFGNLTMKLPQNFRFQANYNFFDYQNPVYKMDQHRAKLNLGHQLFRSLQTNIFTEYGYTKHSIYKETDARIGFNVNYTKKTPIGTFNFSYIYFNRQFRRESPPVPLKVINEEHLISDDEITLLNKPYIKIETIVVKDITGTIIYQQGFDYILVVHNNFTEIKRIPGGQIANNSSVFIDYTSTLPGSFNYNLDNQSLAVSLLLFRQIVEIYYRRGKQDYNNSNQTEFVALNYYLQNIYGMKFKLGFARFGVEYDDYKSSIIPYQMFRYFVNLQWRFKNRLLLSLVGNVRDYIFIGNRKDEFYADISGRAAYSFNSKAKLNLELGYRDQKGYEIDLDLLTARTEFTLIIRKIYCTVGLEVYRRNYLNTETINFNGAYARIVRKF